LALHLVDSAATRVALYWTARSRGYKLSREEVLTVLNHQFYMSTKSQTMGLNELHHRLRSFY
jgi:hypothetical protein